jgi:hypothetical protein
MGRLRSPETSVQNQPTLRNIPQEGRIQLNLQSRAIYLAVFPFLAVPAVGGKCDFDSRNKQLNTASENDKCVTANLRKIF